MIRQFLLFASACAVATSLHAQPVATPSILSALSQQKAALAARPAGGKIQFSTDLSDIWWPNAESGWGIQFVQNVDTIFATMFVYGADNKATFFVSLLTPGGPGWTGDLGATTGPYFGGSFNPALVNETKVGSMSFELIDFNIGILTYDVNGVTVTKTINRQPLVLEDNSGDYSMTQTFLTTGCDAVTQGIVTTQMTIGQIGTTATLFVSYPDANVCQIDATYSQSGRLGSMNGPMNCLNGVTGNWSMTEIADNVRTLSGRYEITNSLGCHTFGRFTAITFGQ